MNPARFSVFSINKQSMECIFPRDSVTGRTTEDWMGNINELIEGSYKVESVKTSNKIRTILSFKGQGSIETVVCDLFKLLAENDWTVIGFVGNETFRNLVCVKQVININVIFNKIRDEIENVTDEDFVIENSAKGGLSKL